MTVARYYLSPADELTAAEVEAFGGEVKVEWLDLDLTTLLFFSDPAAGILRFIAHDDGEPQDQTFGRDWGWVVDALNAEARSAPSSKLRRLEGLFADCAAAMFDDRRIEIHGNRHSSFEVAAGLEVVAEMFGLEGPSARLIELEEVAADA